MDKYTKLFSRLDKIKNFAWAKDIKIDRDLGQGKFSYIATLYNMRNQELWKIRYHHKSNLFTDAIKDFEQYMGSRLYDNDFLEFKKDIEF